MLEISLIKGEDENEAISLVAMHWQRIVIGLGKSGYVKHESGVTCHGIKKITEKAELNCKMYRGAGNGAVGRGLDSHQCDPGSIPGPGVG